MTEEPLWIQKPQTRTTAKKGQQVEKWTGVIHTGANETEVKTMKLITGSEVGEVQHAGTEVPEKKKKIKKQNTTKIRKPRLKQALKKQTG